MAEDISAHAVPAPGLRGFAPEPVPVSAKGAHPSRGYRSVAWTAEMDLALIAAIERRHSMTRAAKQIGVVPKEVWKRRREIGLAPILTARGDAVDRHVLALLIGAAEQQAPCPRNDDIADVLGVASVATPAMCLRRLEAGGYIIVRRYQRTREVTIAATGKSTAPACGDRRPHWRERLAA